MRTCMSANTVQGELEMTLLKISLKLRNQTEDLQKLSQAIDLLSGRLGMTKKCTCETNLVLEELFTNIVQHGCCDGKKHTIDVTLSLKKNILTMRIEDDGVPFNPIQKSEPDRESSLEDRSIGGLGIFLAKQYADDIHYEYDGNKNILTLNKKLILIPDEERVNGNH